MKQISYHGVLAGAYKGRDISARALLIHATANGGVTALCNRVKEDSLCDVKEEGPATCPECAARVRAIVTHLPGMRRTGPRDRYPHWGMRTVTLERLTGKMIVGYLGKSYE